MFSKKYILSGILVFVGLFVVFVSTDTCFRRYVTLRNADVYDYKKLPTQEIQKGGHSFQFIKNNSSESFDRDSINYKGKHITNLDEFLSNNKTTAFIIIQNDTILYENYFNGHKRNTYCKIFSITKNILSSLIGIALDKGYINNINDPIIKYIPELKNKGFDNLTIYHCMNGTAGFKYIKNYFPWSDEAKMYYKPDIRKLLLDLKFVKEPGTYFKTENYSPLLLGFVLERATKKSISQFLQENIWQQLGMEYSALFVLDSEKHKFEKTESGLVLRAIDLAKFGRLYLNKGMWEGKQIISKEWVEESIRLEPGNELGILWQSEDRKEYYKNFWWGFAKNKKVDRYAANGHFGQRLYISPEKKLIIVRLASDSGGVSWGSFISQLIKIL